MPNAPTRLLLFLSSYAPLLVILSIRDSFGVPWARIALLLVAAGSVAALALVLFATQRFTAHSIAVQSVERRDGEAVGYIVAYLLPFLDGYDDMRSRISMGILFAVLGVLYVHSNLIYMNPILNVVGYHLFDVQDSDGKTSVVITRRRYLRVGSDLDVVSLGNYVAVEKKKERRTAA